MSNKEKSEFIVNAARVELILRDESQVAFDDLTAELLNIADNTMMFKNRAAIEYLLHIRAVEEHKKRTGKKPEQDKKHPLSEHAIRNTLTVLAKECIPTLQTGNSGTTARLVYLALDDAKDGILEGKSVLPTFKDDQPIDIKQQSIRYYECDGKYFVNIGLLSLPGSKKLGIKQGTICFEISSKFDSELSILKRVIDGEYKYGTATIKLREVKKGRDNDKKQKYVISFTFTYKIPKAGQSDDPDGPVEGRVLGVDLGLNCAAFMAVSDGYARRKIEGGEISQHWRKYNALRGELQRSRPDASKGSVGHGYNKRMEPLLRLKDWHSRFSKTTNEKYSKRIIDEAVKQKCEAIVLENLKGINKKYKHLADWTYYQLFKMIENKAEKAGIKVLQVSAAYTSQRCSECGYTHKDNRSKDDYTKFRCVECGYTTHADYNAARNIAFRGVEALAKSKEVKKTKATKAA